MQAFEDLLESWAQLIIQCRLTRKNGIAAVGWSFHHT